MTNIRLVNPIPLPMAKLCPLPVLFSHQSELHGQAHVARVMIHAFLLLEATGLSAEASRLWAAVYLHDLAREHDGVCYDHGGMAIRKLERLPKLRELFSHGGVTDDDYEAIFTAVLHHCKPQELPETHIHWRLTALLKDADALDRVRLGDLDPDYLRLRPTPALVPFAERLYRRSLATLQPGPNHLEELWQIARDELTKPAPPGP